MNIVKMLTGAVAAAGLAVATMPAMAEWAPDGPLTIEVGFAPGGSTDTMSRVIGKQIAENTGWNVVVVNKPGGGGTAMMTAISQRPIDPSTLGMGVSAPLLINLVNRPEALPFDLDSFEFISSLARAQVALVARSDAPYDDFAGMIEHSKAEGIPVAFGSGAQKAVLEYVAANSDGNFRFVATKGAAETIPLILGGQVQAGFATGEHIQHVEAGTMKMIVGLNNSRPTYSPDTQTIVESGFDVYVDPISFFATRKGIDPEAKAKLIEVFAEALKSEDVKTIVQNSTRGPVLEMESEALTQAMKDGLESMKLLFVK